MAFLIIVVVGAFFYLIYYLSEDSSIHSDSSRYDNSYSQIRSSYAEPSEANLPKSSSEPPVVITKIHPQIISATPNIKLSLVDGKFRFFQNHYIDGKQYTFGFPKAGAADNLVWIGIDTVEIKRVTQTTANVIIADQSFRSLGSGKMLLSASWKGTGYCQQCNKKLRGNIYKKLCTECYYSNRYEVSYLDWHGTGYCRNCNKKLRGNVYKNVCTECYYNGYN